MFDVLWEYECEGMRDLMCLWYVCNRDEGVHEGDGLCVCECVCVVRM